MKIKSLISHEWLKKGQVYDAKKLDKSKGNPEEQYYCPNPIRVYHPEDLSKQQILLESEYEL